MTIKVLLLGPSRHAISGVSTHLNQIFTSKLKNEFSLVQFTVGSEGRSGGWLSRIGRLVLSPWAFLAILIWQKPDLIHVNTSMNQKAFWRDLIYLLLAKLMRRKVVYQIHGGALPQEFFRGKRLLTALLRQTLLLPDAVVVLAQCELNAYREFVAIDRLLLIANAIELKEIPSRSRSNAGALRIVYLGRIVRSKGLFELVHAAALLRRKGLVFELVLAGEGPDVEELQRYIQRMQIEDCVILPGAVVGEAKQYLLRSSSVMALPSYAEGLPYALLEGMAAGLAVVATDVGAIPDVLDPGCGILVPPQDVFAIQGALQRLLQNAELRASMGQAARHRVQHVYSVEHMAQALASLYDEICSMRAPCPVCSSEH